MEIYTYEPQTLARLMVEADTVGDGSESLRRTAVDAQAAWRSCRNLEGGEVIAGILAATQSSQ